MATKKQIIEAIQTLESELWLDLANYDYQNAPRNGDDITDMTWDNTDTNRKKYLRAWNKVDDLMITLNIPRVENEINDKAFEIRHKLWCERQEARAKGI